MLSACALGPDTLVHFTGLVTHVILALWSVLLYTVSPLRMNLQVRSLKEMHICIYKSSHMLVHMSEVHWHMHAFSKSGCVFVYFTV